MGKKKQKSLSFFSIGKLSLRLKILIQFKSQIDKRQNQDKKLESCSVNTNKSIQIKSKEQEITEACELIGTKKLNNVRKAKIKLSSSNETDMQQVKLDNQDEFTLIISIC